MLFYRIPEDGGLPPKHVAVYKNCIIYCKREYVVNLIVAPCIFVESLLLSTNNCTYITFT